MKRKRTDRRIMEELAMDVGLKMVASRLSWISLDF